MRICKAPVVLLLAFLFYPNTLTLQSDFYRLIRSTSFAIPSYIDYDFKYHISCSTSPLM